MDKTIAFYKYLAILRERRKDEEQLLFDESVTLIALYSRPCRRFWIHDTIQRRTELGEYHRLIRELEADDERFKQYFHMTKDQFDEILGLVDDKLAKQITHYRLPPFRQITI